LSGGRTIIGAALAATILNYMIGVPIGLRMGFRRGLFDSAATGIVDVLIAFPPMIFVLMLIAAAGNSITAAILALVAVQTPRVVRIVRASTLDIVTREYVEAAVARGETTRAILQKDVLPNISTPLLADMGVRFTGSLILFSAMSYLGLGESPPAANWGLMISENRLGLLQSPWLIVVPAVTIAIAAVGANLFADSIAQRGGRSVLGRDA
jgi:peptide/nickel transport system permease protein